MLYKVLSKNDIYDATNVLAKAFYDYPSINYLVTGVNRGKKSKTFF